ncbi:MAG: hypothetical protein WC683_17875 [bacterium]
MDNKETKAAPPAATATEKSVQSEERKTLEAWAAEQPIGPYKPGKPLKAGERETREAENHRCHLAGLRIIALRRFGAFEGAEMTLKQFREVCKELTGHPIGYQQHGVMPAKAV